ncbi:GNAT family N-acetyltransferase [Planococcus sp. ISL-109]|uniref:GNAT family N-acetyltransferase n=1 Tax=Planococcus sp. ISL-109 TaxID=2819166 RepID=UPI001BE968DE|nr:GNAT family N-acetyltransferase [Planococcus sp. ISL-109]MBT2583080.1 GNAT family N-acetyltransferase [Planococcus sp. ISL-109]
MELSLSIASFPLDAETAREMERLISGEPEQCRGLLHDELWQKAYASGFAVLAYTELGELVACAAAADLVGLHHYEWSAFVSLDYRRLGLATALADGIQHSLAQRGMESELAAFLENVESDAWLSSLGYGCAFQELQFEAEPLESYELAGPIEIIRFAEEHLDVLSQLMRQTFDESVLPVLEHNLEDPERHVYLMRTEGKLVATATLSTEDQELWLTALAVAPDAQRSGYGQAFLLWARHLAHQKKLERVLIEVETENEAWPVYEKAGFKNRATISYWQRQEI